MTQCDQPCASTEDQSRVSKIRLINVVFLRILSEIKLKRTDTTLDLSHNGKESWRRKEKNSKELGTGGLFIPRRSLCQDAKVSEFHSHV